MARKVLDYRIDSEGRDHGKLFRITEMPASQAEKWAIRALMALGVSGVDVPDNVRESGAAGLVSMLHTFLESAARMPFDVVEPLLDEMMGCIEFIPDENNKGMTRRLVESDIEEVATRFRLRMATLKLHADFSGAGETSTSGHPSA